MEKKKSLANRYYPHQASGNGDAVVYQARTAILLRKRMFSKRNALLKN
jgi:hypothetical protein